MYANNYSRMNSRGNFVTKKKKKITFSELYTVIADISKYYSHSSSFKIIIIRRPVAGFII